MIIHHSRDVSVEEASEVVLNGTLQIGSHTYITNFNFVAECRCDVLLGMPWHVANNPSIDYFERVVTVNGDAINKHHGQE